MTSIGQTGASNRAPLFHIAERALNRPLVVHPDKAAIIMDVLAGRIGIDGPELNNLSPEASRFFGTNRRDDGSYSTARLVNGVAIVSIVGSLVNRGAWIGANSGLVSYEGIGAQIREAANDPAVHSVILDIDTGGGEAGGITTVAAQIAELAKSKRVVAVVNDAACSGGYWIASAANEIVVSETSVVGSIGVLMLHVNRAGELQQKGWAPTFIYAGAHKVDGNSLGPLPDSVRADVQSTIDDLYDRFIAGVATGRGPRLSEDQARATEARVFHGQAAIAAGLADRFGTFEGVLAELQSRRAGPAARQSRGARMSTETQTQPGADAGYTQAQMDTACAESAKAERTRISTIMSSDVAKDRPAAARQVALHSDMSADAAATFLAGMPAEAKAGAYRTIAERSAEQVECGGDGTSAEAAAKEQANAASGAAAHKKSIAKINAGRG
jgi:capsid assembly protease